MRQSFYLMLHLLTFLATWGQKISCKQNAGRYNHHLQSCYDLVRLQIAVLFTLHNFLPHSHSQVHAACMIYKLHDTLQDHPCELGHGNNVDLAVHVPVQAKKEETKDIDISERMCRQLGLLPH